MGEEPASKACAQNIGCVRWPKGIVYFRLGGAFTSAQAAAARTGFTDWERATNGEVKFSELPDTAGWAFLWAMGWNYHVLVSIDDTIGFKGGLTSFLGYAGYQRIRIHSACATDLSLMRHEMGHVLGLNEEQRRYDRDDHITVVWDNIDNWHEYAFWKIPKAFAWDVSDEYDLFSIMHYGPKAFSCNGLPVFKDKTGNYIYSSGGYQISATDAALMKELY